MPSKTATPNEIFVSYSHRDKPWLERLKVHLKPLERDHQVILWSDTKLRAGDKWRSEIDKALERAKVAILLVSADFLASDFIENNELPPLLKAVEKKGTVILPVIVGSCAFLHSRISQFQAINDPKQPLNVLSEGQLDEVLLQVYGRVYEIFVQPVPPAKSVKSTHQVTVKTSRSKPAARQPKKLKDTVETSKSPTQFDSSANRVPSRSASQDNALLVVRTGEWEMIPTQQSLVGETLELVLLPANAVQRAFLTNLRTGSNLEGIAFRMQTHLCKLQSLHTKTEGRQETWHLTAIRQEMNHRTQITINGISPDQVAIATARLLLLNEIDSMDRPFGWGYGSSSLIEIKTSPFPVLYQLFPQQATAFNKVAPLVATWLLQLSNTVEHILTLKLSLKGKMLKVHFKGQRTPQYQDPPVVIEVEGECDLSQPVTERVLRLAPLKRY